MLQLARNDEDMKKVRLILDELPGNEGKAVPDPYYGTSADFVHVFHLLDRATDQIITNIKHHDNR
jgi:protein-tyrosine phosphatase